MKQLLGFVMFWIGVGILTTFFMPVNGWFVRALAAFSLILVGYNLFSSGGKCGKYKSYRKYKIGLHAGYPAAALLLLSNLKVMLSQPYRTSDRMYIHTSFWRRRQP